MKLLVLSKVVSVYVFGIVFCVLLTPVEPTLAGKDLWPWYPVLAVPGFLVFYVYLSQQYVFGSVLLYWLVYWFGLAMIASGIALNLKYFEKLRSLRTYFIAFPLGFVGTLGVYYGAAQSI